MKAEEEVHLVEEARLKLEEEYLWLKSEDKARLVEEESINLSKTSRHV